MREASYEPPPAIADDARYSMETRLIRTLHAFVRQPAHRVQLWNGDKIAPLGSAPGRDAAHLGPRHAPAPVRGSGPAVRRAVQRRQDRRRRRSWRLIEELYRGGAAARRAADLVRAAPRPVAASPAAQHADRLARQHPSSLRHRQRVLFAVARRDDGVHLRVFPDARRPRSMRRRSPRWITSAASCGCNRGRAASSRPDAAGAASRCTWRVTTACTCARSTSRASRSRSRVSARRRRASIERSRVRRGRLPQHHRSATTRSSSVGMLEHVGVENYPELGRAHRPLPEADTVSA